MSAGGSMRARVDCPVCGRRVGVARGKERVYRHLVNGRECAGSGQTVDLWGSGPVRWAVRWEPYVEVPKCGKTRGPRSRTRCELPPDHVTGRTTGEPRFEVYHFGRSPSGRWFSWLPEVPR